MCWSVHGVTTVLYVVSVQYRTRCQCSTGRGVSAVPYAVSVQYSTRCQYSTVGGVSAVPYVLSVQYHTRCQCSTVRGVSAVQYAALSAVPYVVSVQYRTWCQCSTVQYFTVLQPIALCSFQLHPAAYTSALCTATGTEGDSCDAELWPRRGEIMDLAHKYRALCSTICFLPLQHYLDRPETAVWQRRGGLWSLGAWHRKRFEDGTLKPPLIEFEGYSLEDTVCTKKPLIKTCVYNKCTISVK